MNDALDQAPRIFGEHNATSIDDLTDAIEPASGCHYKVLKSGPRQVDPEETARVMSCSRHARRRQAGRSPSDISSVIEIAMKLPA
jgi:hypothetical protein